MDRGGDVADEQPQSIVSFNTFLANLAVWSGVACALFIGAWRWIRAWCVAVRGWCSGIAVARRFHERWGDAGVEALQAEITQQRWRISELRIRLSATEGLLGIGAFTSDPEQSIEWLSPHAVTLFGFDTVQLVGRNWLARIDEDSRARVEASWRLACGKRIATQSSIMTTDGKWLSLLLCPSIDEAGEVVSVYGQITEPER